MKRYILPLLLIMFCANATTVAPAYTAPRITVLETTVHPTQVRERTLKAAIAVAAKYKGASKIGAENLALWAEIAGSRTNLSPRLLMAVSCHESSCNPKAVSKKGAVGFMQIMPATWGHSRKELRDYRFSLVRGAEILAQYRDDKCNGNLKCALEMYNVGEGNYAKGMRNKKYLARIEAELRDIGGRI